MHYLITGVPRTRTAWLSNLLTYGPSFCAHELLTVAGIDGAAEYLSRLNYKFLGVSDSGAGLAWRKLLQKFPQIKVLRVKRPWKEAAASHHKYFTENPLPGIPNASLAGTELWCHALDEELDKMAHAMPDGRYRIVDFTDLHNEPICAWIWQWLIPGEPFNCERWRLLDRMRINLASEKF